MACQWQTRLLTPCIAHVMPMWCAKWGLPVSLSECGKHQLSRSTDLTRARTHPLHSGDLNQSDGSLSHVMPSYSCNLAPCPSPPPHVTTAAHAWAPQKKDAHQANAPHHSSFPAVFTTWSLSLQSKAGMMRLCKCCILPRPPMISFPLVCYCLIDGSTQGMGSVPSLKEGRC